jgi:hypothetical protein
MGCLLKGAPNLVSFNILNKKHKFYGNFVLIHSKENTKSSHGNHYVKKYIKVKMGPLLKKISPGPLFALRRLCLLI